MRKNIIFTILFAASLFHIILCRPAVSDVLITDVRPSKVLYLSDEDGQGSASVTIKNSGSGQVSGVFRVYDEWNFSESRKVWEEELAISGGQERTVNIAWVLGNNFYGHALRAEFSVEGNPVADKSEFFQVGRRENWFRMFMINGGGIADVPTRDTNPFVTYGNYGNHFSYALSDFADLAPQPPVYYSGQAIYRIVKQELIDKISTGQELGVRHGGYVQSCGGAAAGYELARVHPEWFLRDNRGAFHRVDPDGRPVSPVDLSYPPTQQHEGWYLLAPDFGNPDVVQFGAEEIVRGIDMFGFDAFFFDSVVYGLLFYPFSSQWFGPYDSRSYWTWDGLHYYRGQNPDVASANIQRQVRAIIRGNYPHAILWYNNANPSNAVRREQSLAALEDPMSGTLHENQGLQLIRPDWGMNKWQLYFNKLLSQRDEYMRNPLFSGLPWPLSDTVRAVGYMYDRTFQNTGDMTQEEWIASRDTWTTARHIGAFYTALTYHPCLTSSTSWRPTVQFMTRYSSFLWDEGIEVMENPAEKFTVTGNRDVWWEDTVYTKQNGDTILHFVNVPETEDVDIKATEDPPAADIEVEMKTSPGEGKFAVMSATPYDYNDTVREPKEIQIAPHTAGDKIVIDIPPFTYYSMLVIRPAVLILDVAPDTLDFGMAENTLSFSIRNTGTGTIDWSIGPVFYNQGSGWISSVNPSSGAVMDETDSVTVTVNRNALGYGLSTAVMPVSSDAGAFNINVFIRRKSPPLKPVNISPADGAVNVSRMPLLTASAFYDPEGDTMLTARWRIKKNGVIIWNSANLSNSIQVPAGVLDTAVSYTWQARYVNSYGVESEWSDETVFTTRSAGQSNPGTPTNISPANMASGIALYPLLTASSFFDPDGDAMENSYWRIRAESGSYEISSVWEAENAGAVTSIVVTTGLVPETRYFWQVRYADISGLWSSWSQETSFSTISDTEEDEDDGESGGSG